MSDGLLYRKQVKPFLNVLTTLALGVLVMSAQADLPPGESTPVATLDLPVTRAVLFSSGVGYYEHTGQIDGSATLRLLFQTDQINDVLKSMILIDHGGGRIRSVSYPTNEPLERALASFGVNISDNPSLPQLLQRLRGTEVTLHAPDRIRGKVFNVAERTQVIGSPPASVTEHLLTLWTESGGLRTIPLDSIASLELMDERLQRELSQALALLASSHDSERRPVDIHFEGQAARTVQVGYLLETPVWKTTYRLDLSDLETLADDSAGTQSALLQGWALVENTSDTDWQHVQLSLISGRPISFRMDLYTPLFLERPEVELPLTTLLRPPRHEAGRESFAAMEQEVYALDSAVAGSAAMARMAMPSPAPAMMMESAPAARVDRDSATPVAQADQLGELFAFTIEHPVDLARRQAAMLPLLMTDIEAERLSIYNATVHPQHPLNGAWLRNTSGMALPGGPMTVYDAGMYAGDAQIDHLATDDERLISYAVDLSVRIDNSQGSERSITAASINRGVMRLQQKTVWTTVYTLNSSAEMDRQIVLEHPRGTQRKLTQPANVWQDTADLYRFKVMLPAQTDVEFTVQEEQTHLQSLRLTDLNLGQLLSYHSNAEISASVRETLQPAIVMHQALDQLQRQLREQEQRQRSITQDQARIRDNLNSVGSSSSLGRRYLQTLGQQEDQLEEIQRAITQLNQQIQDKRQELQRYLNQIQAEI